MPKKISVVATTALMATLAAASLAACSSSSDDPDPAAGGTTSAAPGSVTLVTHDSFALSDGILDDFTAQTGITVKVVQQGDAGALVNQLVLTKDAPLGDATFGIDNTFASRAIDEGVVVPYTSAAPAAADAAQHSVGDGLTAVDYGDVCINVDHAWFTKKKLAEPTSLDDLTDPRYKDLLVVPNAVTSSPGFAFLLATIGAKGDDGWQAYWEALKKNGLKVADGWSDAYFTDFSGGGADGPRPIVLSYASSPPSTVPKGGGDATTGALLDTCFRQTEYAGVLAGAKNPAGAEKLIDFLLSDEVQADIPGSMYMYPVSKAVAIPADWEKFAPLATTPFDVDPAAIAANRATWLADWSQTVIG
ncbi:thiamine ABC transporter substrate binding subunit [Cellulomonas sp. PhB150]|uniref:thiamine ABC transporter substrate-binding protein n=1 Tax=Cellulomonas sp. PhB150 TaxID=2485188 RepID=UPI000F485407|nr:thiamine ABC transporter substrate-binding protein [Cellulomonas sp. PhB150]ROS23794.1 thiamine transport system substrate-binding protein [Cellulomonas sp. PhB150]